MAKFFKRLHEQQPSEDPLAHFDAESGMLPESISLDELLGFTKGRISEGAILALFKMTKVSPTCYRAILNSSLFDLKQLQESPTLKPEVLKLLRYVKEQGVDKAIANAEEASRQSASGEENLVSSGMSGEFCAEAIQLRAAMAALLRAAQERDEASSSDNS